MGRECACQLSATICTPASHSRHASVSLMLVESMRVPFGYTREMRCVLCSIHSCCRFTSSSARPSPKDDTSSGGASASGGGGPGSGRWKKWNLTACIAVTSDSPGATCAQQRRRD